jgi:hypothetical protein
MASASKQIYVGGWARFREESGVTKKEPVEDFSWMSRGTLDYEDCRDAIARVPGAKEYIKTYVAVQEGAGFNFDGPIGKQINLGHHHSGASRSEMLLSYHQVLKDWDGWVLGQKEYRAYEGYKNVQVGSNIIVGLYYSCKNFLEKPEGGSWSHTTIVEWAAKHGLHGDIKQIYPILAHLYTEHMARTALEAEQKKKEAHRVLIDSLAWKYKHPGRWFDTPYGSTISPPTPDYITEDAYSEMEAKYPGYRAHIQRVKTAMGQVRLPQGVTRFSAAGEAYMKNMLTHFQITV